MQVKLLEIRDSGTFIPVLAVKVEAADEAERYLLESAGYVLSPDRGEPYILLAPIDPGAGACAGKINYDPDEWYPSRTLQVAHEHIIRHWDELETGAVVDVEYLLGKRAEPKKPQRLGRSR